MRCGKGVAFVANVAAGWLALGIGAPRQFSTDRTTRSMLERSGADDSASASALS
ncbi:MAG: hypothetical protein NTW72_01170 [Gemmatimonadetes bacterium]|nr:hypothetical protein [Gemmatimonadota bacterium]